MSDVKLRLTEKQRVWANAFLSAMGETSAIGKDELVAPKTSFFKKAEPLPTGGVKGSLDTLDKQMDQEVGVSLEQMRSRIGGQGEDVGRVGGSKDKGYARNVREPVDALLDQADQMVKDGTLAEGIEGLLSGLREQYKHYSGNLVGEKNQDKLDQRRRKMEAIANRIKALQGLASATEDLQGERELHVMMLEEDEQIQALKENPEVLIGIVAKKPDPATLAKLLTKIGLANSDEKLIAEMLAPLQGDPTYIQELTGKLLDTQGAMETGQTLFRLASPAKAISRVAIKQDQVGGAYINAFTKDRDQLLSSLSGKTGKDDVIMAAFVNNTVSKVIGQPLPAIVLNVLMKFAANGQGKAVDAVAQIKQQLILLLIAPELTGAPKIKGGKKMSVPESKAAALVGKALQQIANGAPVRSGMDEYPLTAASVGTNIQRLSDWGQQVWDDYKMLYGF